MLIDQDLSGLYRTGGLEERCRRELKWLVVEGSKVERVKRRRVKKKRSAQMDMVDWALQRRWLEVVRLRGGDEEEEEEDGEKRLVVFFLSISMG